MTPQQQLAVADQQKAIDYLFDQYKNGKNILGLYGYAGVGKTTCVKELIRLISDDMLTSPSIGLLANSHAAKTVIRNVFKDYKGDVTDMTIASALSLGKTVDPKTGIITFEPKPKSYYDKRTRSIKYNPLPISGFDIIIVDESSQLNKTKIDMIIENKKKSAVLIFLGDKYQTPPLPDNTSGSNTTSEINPEFDKDSPCFDIESKYELTIPYRYEGNIQKLSLYLCSQIDNLNKLQEYNPFSPVDMHGMITNKLKSIGTSISDVKSGEADVIVYNGSEPFIQEAVNAFKDNKLCTVICYRNEKVEQVAKLIRSKLLPAAQEYYVIGDRIILRDTIVDDNKMVVAPSMTLFEVQNIQQRTTFISYNIKKDSLDVLVTENEELIPKDFIKFPIKTYNLTIKSLSPDNPIILSNVRTFRSSTNPLFENIRKVLYEHCFSTSSNWDQYYSLLEAFPLFQYAYAVNTYVVQGATYDEVFVLTNDILAIKPISSKAKFQSLNTAVTRAKYKTHLLV